jgi:hypothetical protein
VNINKEVEQLMDSYSKFRNAGYDFEETVNEETDRRMKDTPELAEVYSLARPYVDTGLEFKREYGFTISDPRADSIIQNATEGVGVEGRLKDIIIKHNIAYRNYNKKWYETRLEVNSDLTGRGSVAGVELLKATREYANARLHVQNSGPLVYGHSKMQELLWQIRDYEYNTLGRVIPIEQFYALSRMQVPLVNVGGHGTTQRDETQYQSTQKPAPKPAPAAEQKPRPTETKETPGGMRKPEPKPYQRAEWAKQTQWNRPKPTPTTPSAQQKANPPAGNQKLPPLNPRPR